MRDQTQKWFDDITKHQAAKGLLEANPIGQQICFDVEDGEAVTVNVEPYSAEVAVEPGKTPYELFKTTVIRLDQETFQSLLNGDLFSPYYLEGDLEVRGLPSVKILLGQLFRINRESMDRIPNR